MGDLILISFALIIANTPKTLSLQSFNLTPTIDKPTSVHHNSYSLVDNTFASNLEDTITSGNIISDLTDRFSQFCILNPSNDLLDLRSKKCYSVTSLIIQRQNTLNELSQLFLCFTINFSVSTNLLSQYRNVRKRDYLNPG